MKDDKKLQILIFGANYGLILAVKFALAGHHVTIVGHQPECELIALDGAHIVYPDGQTLSANNKISSTPPENVDPDVYDIAFLVIQEPQAVQSEIAKLILNISEKIPIASLMNLPPEPFLRRLGGFSPFLWRDSHTASKVWDQVSSERFTCASPDPQAFRPDAKVYNILQVSHVANFKFAPFASSSDQSILTRLSRDIENVRFETGKRAPIQIVRTNSVYAPLAKWPMLVTGNCRCVRDGRAPISIYEAVNTDLNASRTLYNGVVVALIGRGVPASCLVDFDHYVKATQTLTRPSSLALAIERGTTKVERIDRLVCNLLTEAPNSKIALNQILTIRDLIDQRLNSNISHGSLAVS